MNVLIFSECGWKTPIHGSKIIFWLFDLLDHGVQYQRRKARKAHQRCVCVWVRVIWAIKRENPSNL